MMLNTKDNLKDFCDFCSSSDLSHIYTPIKSKRGMEVVFCNDCGLFESISTTPYDSRPPGNLSCDADRSSLKITKGLTFGNYKHLLEKYFISSDAVNIIDIGSNRGTFVEWAESNLNVNKITAIETDVLITGDYAKNKNLDLIVGRFEEIHDLKDNYYDLAYCVHTLEHASSAFLMLNKIYDCLNLNGLFFLAVPNLNWSNDALVEYFIDPHTFHFDSVALENFLQKTGFEIVHKNDQKHFESIYVLKKTSKAFFKESDKGFKLDRQIIKRIMNDFSEYKSYLLLNRKHVNEDASELKAILALKKKVIFWGAGCIFDAIRKFGNITPNDNIFLVDKYLPANLNEVSGFKLYYPDEIANIIDDDSYLYIASKDYKEEIIEEASVYNFKNIFCFGDKINV